MRVNLDLGKLLYSYMIMKDKNMPGAVVRTSTIPEELGRISYLFTDKTGEQSSGLFQIGLRVLSGTRQLRNVDGERDEFPHFANGTSSELQTGLFGFASRAFVSVQSAATTSTATTSESAADGHEEIEEISTESSRLNGQ